MSYKTNTITNEITCDYPASVRDLKCVANNDGTYTHTFYAPQCMAGIQNTKSECDDLTATLPLPSGGNQKQFVCEKRDNYGYDIKYCKFVDYGIDDTYDRQTRQNECNEIGTYRSTTECKYTENEALQELQNNGIMTTKVYQCSQSKSTNGAIMSANYTYCKSNDSYGS